MEILELADLDCAEVASGCALKALESGGLIVFPRLPFELEADEARFLDPAILSDSKNVSLDPASGALGGTRLSGEAAEALGVMVRRFSRRAECLLAALSSAVAPAFGPGPWRRGR